MEVVVAVEVPPALVEWAMRQEERHKVAKVPWENCWLVEQLAELVRIVVDQQI